MLTSLVGVDVCDCFKATSLAFSTLKLAIVPVLQFVLQRLEIQLHFLMLI